MGFRTVVMLNNDQTHNWSADPKLGEKIHRAMATGYGRPTSEASDFGYGRVVECVHADTQTLAVLDSCRNFMPLTHTTCLGKQHPEHPEGTLQLLKDAAAKLGYRLTKKAVKK